MDMKPRIEEAASVDDALRIFSGWTNLTRPEIRFVLQSLWDKAFREGQRAERGTDAEGSAVRREYEDPTMTIRRNIERAERGISQVMRGERTVDEIWDPEKNT